MSLGSCCFSGVVHEGTPKGSIATLNGVTGNYVALPSGEYDKTKALLFLPDAFGASLVNAQLLADSFAENGIPTYVIDYLYGDPVPAEAMSNPSFDWQAWFAKHGSTDTRPLLDKAIEGLKAQGITTFAATGYCFGGRYVTDLVLDQKIKVAVVAHPSLLKVPEDLLALKEKAPTIPFLWNNAELDYMFNLEQQAKAEEIFKGMDSYVLTTHKGCEHGFAVRGDMSNPLVKAGKETAFEATVKFVKAHL